MTEFEMHVLVRGNEALFKEWCLEGRQITQTSNNGFDRVSKLIRENTKGLIDTNSGDSDWFNFFFGVRSTLTWSRKMIEVAGALLVAALMLIVFWLLPTIALGLLCLGFVYWLVMWLCHG